MKTTSHEEPRSFWKSKSAMALVTTLSGLILAVPILFGWAGRAMDVYGTPDRQRVTEQRVTSLESNQVQIGFSVEIIRRSQDDLKNQQQKDHDETKESLRRIYELLRQQIGQPRITSQP